MRAAPAAERDDGLSLVELLVTMAMVAVLSPLVVGLLARVSTSARTTLASASNAADARLALAYLEGQVRSGNQPLTVSATAVSLSTCADQGVPGDVGRVRVVEFRISAGELQARSRRASAATPGPWRRLVSGVGAGSGFAADGTSGVRVTLAVTGTDGRPARGDTMVSPRNAALPTPLPELCP